MDKVKAIETICEAFRIVENEQCCSDKERKATHQDMYDSLMALGVTKDEIDVYVDW